MENTGFGAPTPLEDPQGEGNPPEDREPTIASTEYDARSANNERLLEHKIISENFRVNKTEKHLMERARSFHLQLPPPEDQPHLDQPLSMTRPPGYERNILFHNEFQNEFQQEQFSSKKKKLTNTSFHSQSFPPAEFTHFDIFQEPSSMTSGNIKNTPSLPKLITSFTDSGLEDSLEPRQLQEVQEQSILSATTEPLQDVVTVTEHEPSSYESSFKGSSTNERLNTPSSPPSATRKTLSASPVNAQRKRKRASKDDPIPYVLLPFGPHSNLPSGHLAPTIAQCNPRNPPYIPTRRTLGKQSNPHVIVDNEVGVESAPSNINVPKEVASAWVVSLPEETGGANRVTTYHHPPSQAQQIGPRMSNSSQAPSLVPGVAGTVPRSSRVQSQASSMASQPSAPSPLDPHQSLLQPAQFFRGKIPDITRLITNLNTWGNTIDPTNCTAIEREVQMMAKDSAILSVLSLSYRAFEWFTKFAPIKFPAFLAQGKSFLTQRDDLIIENASLKARIEVFEKERALREEADMKAKPYILPKANRLYVFGNLPEAENPLFRCQAMKDGEVCGAHNRFYVKDKEISFVWIDRVKCSKCRQKFGCSVEFLEPEKASGEMAFLGRTPTKFQPHPQPQPPTQQPPVPTPAPAVSGIFSAPPIRSGALSALSMPSIDGSTPIFAPVPGPAPVPAISPVSVPENDDNNDDMESLFGADDGEEGGSDAELEAALRAALEEE
ncbi:hypothetical protein HYALB_00013576 [Hymenoscyphus albidus]|uniref:Uncharacterized protein n=1 Tax=Hymenoscyphus albidus TaxID=595503 RepID=A0A9N9PZL3_9HELO|nr:hypothetical protein HYALB_00013576 [Hymenoscyphus albidus]